MSDLPQDYVDRINEALFAGRKVAAIKLYRERVGGSLVQAKDYIEAIEVGLRDEFPERFTARSVGTATYLLTILILVLFTTAGFALFWLLHKR